MSVYIYYPHGTQETKNGLNPLFVVGGEAKSGKKKTHHSPFCWILKSILVVVNFFISNPNPPQKKKKKHDSARPHRLFFISSFFQSGWGSWSQVHRSSPAVLDKKEGSLFRDPWPWVPKLGGMLRNPGVLQSHVARGEMKNLHAAVARSSCSSQNVQNTRVLKHFWRFGCRKGVRQMR